MRKIKSAVIGTGFIGPAHIEALRRIGFVEVKTLVEKDIETAKNKAKLLNIPNYTADYKEVLADKEIEVVHNCTPNFLHYKINMDLLDAGKHIISEKPLAMNSTESKALVKKAKEKKVFNAVNFNYRFYPLIQQAKAMIAKGVLGKLYLVHGSYLQDWLLLDTDYNWRLEPKVGGESRAIADVGSHWCDLIQYLTNDQIVSLYADLATIIPIRKKPKKDIETYSGKALKPSDYENVKITTEDYGSILLKFKSGMRGVLTVSQVSAGRKNRLYFEIDGSKSSIAWDQEKPEEMWIGHRDKSNELLVKDPSILYKEAQAFAHYPGGHPEGYPDGPKNFFKIFYSKIANGEKPQEKNNVYATFEDGHKEILMVEAVLKSAKENKWININYNY